MFRKGEVEAFKDYLKCKFYMWQVPAINLYEWRDNLSAKNIEDIFNKAFQKSDELIINYTEQLNGAISIHDFYKHIPPILTRYGPPKNQEEELRVIEFTDLLINKKWKEAYDFIKSFNSFSLRLQDFYIGNQTNKLVEDLLANKLNCLKKGVIAIEGNATNMLNDIIEVLYGEGILNALAEDSKQIPKVMSWKASSKWTLFYDDDFQFVYNENIISQLSEYLNKEVVVFIIDNSVSLYRFYTYGKTFASFKKENDFIEGQNLSNISQKHLSQETDFSDIFQFASISGIDFYLE